MTTFTSTEARSPLSDTFATFFDIKSSANVEGTMSFFSPNLVTYIDATLGWDLDSYQVLKSAFEQYMPNWTPPARSYTTAMFSNETSALLHMVDTPELFGGELRILAAVDFVDGKIVRWVDYWDATYYPDDLYAQYRTPADQFPRDLRDADVPTQAAPELVGVATPLHHAFATGDASLAADLMHTDVILEDRSLRASVLGRIETTRYLNRVLPTCAYGRGSRLRHVVGGTNGGGFEWTAGSHAHDVPGITAIELDPDGLITRITSVYDSRQLDPSHKAALANAVN